MKRFFRKNSFTELEIAEVVLNAVREELGICVKFINSKLNRGSNLAYVLSLGTKLVKIKVQEAS